MSEVSCLSAVGSLISGVSTLAIAVAAWVGLSSWKKQERAKIKSKFLDEIADAAFDYMNEISPLVSLLTFFEIGIQSYSESAALLGSKEWYAGIQKFVEVQGKDNSKKMNEYLDKVKLPKTRMKSLSIKGQVLGFDGYGECLDACDRLALSSDQIEAYATMLGSPHWNYDNDIIKATVTNTLENVTSAKIQKDLYDNHTRLLKFLKKQYRGIF